MEVESSAVRLWEVPDRFNPDTTFSIELVLQDEKGDRIHASIGKSVLHLFKTQINELGLHLMANFIVCQNKERFNTTKHRLRLTFTQWTTVAEIIDPLFPMNIFDMRPYHQLINKVDVNESELFDVIGEIINFSEVHTQEKGKISRKCMDIELEDDERNKLSTTFWGEFVDHVLPHLLNSYSVRNTLNASKLWINPTFPQSDEFKTRLLSVRDSYSERLTQIISQQSYSVSDEIEKSIVEVKTIGQLVESVQNLKKDGRMSAARSVKNVHLFFFRNNGWKRYEVCNNNSWRKSISMAAEVGKIQRRALQGSFGLLETWVMETTMLAIKLA
ncbi:PREDICTED: uncharacterized protein LOC109209110 [Nicotiana attenuata]|uniref:uncharacterized protein LOC109209110 n=1 Tax=Nicotiana attenuata TaxID=49451 RepID=UPI0009054F9E|nr:PREDICTED: uncharacterized protein LOC109209110 [Nicotiana attenuata]